MGAQNRIMYVCTECAESNPEMCGYYDRTNLGVMPDGRWLCENCLSDLPEAKANALKCPPAYRPEPTK
jgi:hypothetical protein